MSTHPDRPVGEVFLDARGHGRALRLTWHHEADVVVLSLWREDTCAGTFRLVKDDVNEFIDALVAGLRDERALPHGPTGQPAPAAEDAAGFRDWAFGDGSASRATAS